MQRCQRAKEGEKQKTAEMKERGEKNDNRHHRGEAGWTKQL